VAEFTRQQRRELSQAVKQHSGYPMSQVCQVLGIARSSVYYRAKVRDEGQLRAAVEQVSGQFPTYGSRRITAQLRRSPHNQTVGRKRVQRVMREMGLVRPVKRKTCRTTNSVHAYPRYPNRIAGLTITRPDQVWVSDITYVRLGVEFVYLAVIMDVFTRTIRGWHLSRSLDLPLTLNALRMALRKAAPAIHHSDQGGQYAAHEYVRLLTQCGTQISMAATGKPEENGFAERLMRTIKEEEVDLSEYHDFADAHAQIGHFIDTVYHTKRIHSALGYLTPAEFEAAWLSQESSLKLA
jgi:putative transposase